MTNRYRDTQEEVLSMGAYVKLQRAAESVSTRVHRYLVDENLSVRQFGVLEALYHTGPLYQRDIANKLLVSGGNITMVLDNLGKNDLVKRAQDPGDRRHNIVSLTEKGKKLMDRIFPRHASRIVQEMGVLTAKNQKTLGDLCRKLGKGKSAH
jgi:MarR family 2-MHQ and catechol resistance regulon transcriptional repressor